MSECVRSVGFRVLRLIPHIKLQSRDGLRLGPLIERPK